MWARYISIVGANDNIRGYDDEIVRGYVDLGGKHEEEEQNGQKVGKQVEIGWIRGVLWGFVRNGYG